MHSCLTVQAPKWPTSGARPPIQSGRTTWQEDKVEPPSAFSNPDLAQENTNIARNHRRRCDESDHTSRKTPTDADT